MEYLEELIRCLHSVQIYDNSGIACRDYEESMDKLVELF